MAELEELRDQAAALGVKVDGRWGVDRLRAEVEAAQPPAPADQHVDDVVEDQGGDQEHDDVVDVEDQAEQRVFRAGGHINRGDGRGWVIEE